MTTKKNTPIRRTVTQSIATEIRGTLAYGDLEALVRKAVPDAPPDAEIILAVEVPGGGDWSNESLDLVDHPVRFAVRWTTSTEGD